LAVVVSGGLVHGHTVYQNPVLAALSEEELGQLDTITQKLVMPVASTSPDTSQNQIESNTATNVPDRNRASMTNRRNGKTLIFTRPA
jgi:hypothetical protein